MPLSPPAARREIHERVISMKAYQREDGLYDIEARLIDTKPFAFQRISLADPLPPGEALHDLSLRLTVDRDYVVRAVEASSDATPYSLCKETESTLSVLVGDRIASGWSSTVKAKLRGAASCTHLMEMLIPMGTTAFQGINGVQREGQTTVDTSKIPVRVDSCYSYAKHRSVIQRYWPQHYQPDSE
ncbi:DUF2889 domain-containing protein [Cupriavidus sp. DF5525]|uniref:DUF2889 domain-containing protein n=1 Tax=Cupriavidus sp. DF5525 TaxID=3160989 RepID=UPI0032DEFFA7